MHPAVSRDRSMGLALVWAQSFCDLGQQGGFARAREGV